MLPDGTNTVIYFGSILLQMRATLLLCLLNFSLFGQISEVRQRQLDSVVTNIDRNTLLNLDSLHAKLHATGRNDEERVFLYFGLVAIQYKYDNSRKGDRSAKEYTAYYVAQKKKGVCRDFALIFKELCDRSEIPCVIATGRVNVPIWEAVPDLFKRRQKRINHAWNVVKVNDKWNPIDPNWSKIDSKRKYYTYDDRGRGKYAGKLKISNRDYYDKHPTHFYRKRKCVHPAFYCMNTVYTYKTSNNKYKNRKVLITDYDYSSVLDSIAGNQTYVFSKEYQETILNYAKVNYISAELSRDFKFAELKRSRFDQCTSSQCTEHLSQLKEKTEFLKEELDYDLTFKYEEHKTQVLKLKKKLERRENSAKLK